MRFLIVIIMTSSITALAHPGIGIVKDSKGNVFYTDLSNVWMIDTHGTKTIAVKGVHTHELSIDDNDNLFGEHLWYSGEATDRWGYFVWKLTPAGELTKVIPDTPGFREDYSFVRDHLGRMYQAEGSPGCQHIKRIDLDKISTKISDICLGNVRWMATGADGCLYLVDGPDIKTLDAAGHVSTLAESLQQAKLSQFFVNRDHYLGGLTVDDDQNIYVCDFSARNVKKITREGQLVIVVETSIPWSPSGILLEENGDLWILEYSITNDARVEKVRRNGKRTIF